MNKLAVQEIRCECVNFTTVIDMLSEEGCITSEEEKCLKTQIKAIKGYVCKTGTYAPFTTAKSW